MKHQRQRSHDCWLYCCCPGKSKTRTRLDTANVLFSISNFPIKLHKDAHGLLSPLAHVASAAVAERECIRRQGLQALLVGIYFWRHTPVTYIFSVPVAYSHAAFGCLSNASFHAFLVFV